MEDWDRIWQTAWARYVSAALLIWFAIWFAQQDANGKHWWLPVAAFIYALIRAREISIGVLVLGGIYLIFHGIAALPVSVAVIVGAMIIASAMKK
jgi:hypothetical protein